MGQRESAAGSALTLATFLLPVSGFSSLLPSDVASSLFDVGVVVCVGRSLARSAPKARCIASQTREYFFRGNPKATRRSRSDGRGNKPTNGTGGKTTRSPHRTPVAALVRAQKATDSRGNASRLGTPVNNLSQTTRTCASSIDLIPGVIRPTDRRTRPKPPPPPPPLLLLPSSSPSLALAAEVDRSFLSVLFPLLPLPVLSSFRFLESTSSLYLRRFASSENCSTTRRIVARKRRSLSASLASPSRLVRRLRAPPFETTAHGPTTRGRALDRTEPQALPLPPPPQPRPVAPRRPPKYRDDP